MAETREYNFYYADVDALKKHFEAIPATNRRKRKLAQEIASIIDAVIKDKENPGLLAKTFKKLEDRHPPRLIQFFVEATKTYLNSEEFKYPGKYKTRSWFGGEIKYVSENKNNPTISIFNEVLDKLIQEYDKKTTDLPDSKIKILIKMSSTSCKPITLTNNHGVAIGYGILLAVNAVAAHEYVVDHDHALFGFENLSKAAALKRLPEFYEVISNVPIGQVRYWGFTETHPNYTHHKLVKEIIPIIGDPGDILLFEGYEAGVEFPCHQLCLSLNDENEYGKSINSHCVENFGFDKFKCFGSDKMQITTLALSHAASNKKRIHESSVQTTQNNQANQAIAAINKNMAKTVDLIQNRGSSSDILARVKDIYRELKDLSKTFPALNRVIEPQLASLKTSIKEYETSFGLYHDTMAYFFGLSSNIQSVIDCVNLSGKILAEIQKIIGENIGQVNSKMKAVQDTSQSYSDPVAIGIRNEEGLIKTMELPFVKNHQGNVFFFWGSLHPFPSDRPARRPRPDEAQYKLDQYLNTKPHWLGRPW